jgi:5-methylcytosine-specific restriction endonuclease McrA
MKRTKLRKRSKSKYYIDRADRALQDYYRALHLKCEVCGAPADLMHHFIEKSRSNYLRFNEINLVPLCKKCHFKHHNTGDTTIHAIIIQKRGQKWLKKIIELSRIKRLPFSVKEIIEIIDFYKKKLVDLLRQKGRVK